MSDRKDMRKLLHGVGHSSSSRGSGSSRLAEAQGIPRPRSFRCNYRVIDGFGSPYSLVREQVSELYGKLEFTKREASAIIITYMRLKKVLLQTKEALCLYKSWASKAEETMMGELDIVSNQLEAMEVEKLPYVRLAKKVALAT
ncbi:hypothetical protein TanjilG_00006 [Lupinus angustifolius]|uniref:Uncharacterized protein n=1 Tax=Lupinus angustifolius TaxID=3871 RepID=A0A4P1QSQ8_LUPAN|nr:hypothetical protein TanjilG_00006 [Lupinus angustifolius]